MAELPSSNVFGSSSGSEPVESSSATSLTFGTLARPSFQVTSSDSIPLFPVTTQSTSKAFGVANTNKPKTGLFGRAFTAATRQPLAKEKQEQVADDKMGGVDISNLTALVIKDIPESYNKNAWLKRFYSRFGEVTKVLCSTAKKSATVTFKTHVSIPYESERDARHLA